MSRPIIGVEALSKRYQLGAIGATTLRQALRQALHRLRHRTSAADPREFWALRDLSFSIQPGEVVGLIGRNGAGKSTLLKVLSRITEPTGGRAVLRGRVASLIEIGAGFHPQLTGRENIYLNGTILGMSRAEVARKFDEIVAFAEVEQFVDTPIKRFSSGMYVRLGFAVAAHLEPEVLIVDEVLSVGDARFQARCIGKMREVSSRDGRTVLFVSHNMLTVQSLCSRALHLQRGRLVDDGPALDVVTRYLSHAAPGAYAGERDPDVPKVLSAAVTSAPLLTNLPLEIDIAWHVPAGVPGHTIEVGLYTSENQCIFEWVPADSGLVTPSTPGDHRLKLRIPPHTLMARTYQVAVNLRWRKRYFDRVNPAFTVGLEAAPGGPYDAEPNRSGLVHVRTECDLLV